MLDELIEELIKSADRASLVAHTRALDRVLQYGYYVMPILEGDRLVGRVDPKHHREHDALEIRRVWWEPGVRATRLSRNVGPLGRGPPRA